MRTFLSGLCAFVLLSGLVAGCTDSNQRGVGENPNRERTPSASPPTSTMPDTGRAPGGSSGPGGTPSTPSTPPSR